MGITATDDKPELVKYELQEQIGHGGMATVYRALDRRLGRDVAVKLIHPHLRGNREVAARFVSEGRAVAKLKHSNIVEVYDISDETEPERYLVVELIEGPTLRRLLEERRYLPPEVAAVVGLHVAAALGHAHEQHIIHRDVKPENVLVDTPKRTSRPHSRQDVAHVTVKLTDFGIAKLLDAHGVTSTGQVLGSPAHMAPEQIEGGVVDARADVFGLGVLLYEMMAGKLPFDGANPAQVLRKVLDGEHEAACRVRPQVGARWSAILDRALAKNASERFESIEALAKELRAELERLGFTDEQAELDRYLADPEEYQVRHAVRVAEALAKAGEAARARGDVGLASDSFNRALSYRPGDPELLARVSSVARNQQVKRVARLVAIGAVSVTVVAGAWAAWSTHPSPGTGKGEGAATSSKKPAIAPTSESRKTAPSPSASVLVTESVTRRPPRLRTEANPLPRRAAPPTEPIPVVVHVRGAKGGKLLIDGQERANWLNTPVLLEPGPHTFKFELNNKCCVDPSVTAEISPENREVVLQVTYSDAELDLRGPSGVLSCGMFGGQFGVPGRHNVRMGQLEEVSAKCKYSPEDRAASPKWYPSVTLAPGRTTTLNISVP